MSLIRTVETNIDLKAFRLWFLYAAAGALFLTPIIFLQNPGQKLNEVHESSVIAVDGSNDHSLFNYEAALKESPLFAKPQEIEQTVIVQKIDIAELTKPYSLKGIALSGEPEAIIQDSTSQKMLFVKIGDSLGALTVANISEGKITVTYEEQERVLSIE